MTWGYLWPHRPPGFGCSPRTVFYAKESWVNQEPQFNNLVLKYEFYNNREFIILHEVIQNLIANEKINLLATA
jgi:hypothetical protein